MAVDAGRYARGRSHDDRASKERRQKLILAAGTGVLAVLLAIQLPRILSRGGDEPAVAPEVSAPRGVPSGSHEKTTATAASAAARSSRLAIVRSFAAKDPFTQAKSRSGATAAVAPSQAAGPYVRSTHFFAKDPFAQQGEYSPSSTARVPQEAAGPAVRATHFVAKDPFAEQSGASGEAVVSSAGGSGASTSAAAHASRAVVVLASIPVPAGYRNAAHVARVARARGLAGAGVLRSSAYRTLRPGFYVVYGKIYATTNGAVRGLAAARAHGFPAAYTRPLGR